MKGLKRFQLRIDSAASGSRNMCLDLELLNTVERSPEPASLVRLYSWSTATVSLGKHQQPDRALDLEFCAAESIPWVHRPTGGRAVFHDCELTYAVASNDARTFPFGDILGTYRRIALALREGLSSLGVATEFSRGLRDGPGDRGKGLIPCFASASRFELTVQGRKVAGSAQRRLRRSFLQHGSIPLKIDYPRTARVLGFSAETLRAKMISVSEAAGRDVSFNELALALEAGFRFHFELESE